jgi:hypothetical protein
MGQSDFIKYKMDKYEASRGKRDYVGVITQTKFQPRIEPLQRYGPTDRWQLTSSGVGDVQATLAIPYVNFVPRNSDADSLGVQVIISAIQNRLGLKPTGYLDKNTEAAIGAVSGPAWFDKKWNAILADAIKGNQKARKSAPLQAVSGYGDGNRQAETYSKLKTAAKIAGIGAIGIWGYAYAAKNRSLQKTAGAVGLGALLMELLARRGEKTA